VWKTLIKDEFKFQFYGSIFKVINNCLALIEMIFNFIAYLFVDILFEGFSNLLKKLMTIYSN